MDVNGIKGGIKMLRQRKKGITKQPTLQRNAGYVVWNTSITHPSRRFRLELREFGLEIWVSKKGIASMDFFMGSRLSPAAF